MIDLLMGWCAIISAALVLVAAPGEEAMTLPLLLIWFDCAWGLA